MFANIATQHQKSCSVPNSGLLILRTRIGTGASDREKACVSRELSFELHLVRKVDKDFVDWLDISTHAFEGQTAHARIPVPDRALGGSGALIINSWVEERALCVQICQLTKTQLGSDWRLVDVDGEDKGRASHL